MERTSETPSTQEIQRVAFASDLQARRSDGHVASRALGSVHARDWRPDTDAVEERLVARDVARSHQGPKAIFDDLSTLDSDTRRNLPTRLADGLGFERYPSRLDDSLMLAKARRIPRSLR